MIQDMINSETIWIQLNRQTQTYSKFCLYQKILTQGPHKVGTWKRGQFGQ